MENGGGPRLPPPAWPPAPAKAGALARRQKLNGKRTAEEEEEEEEAEEEEEEATRGLLIFLQGTQTLQYPSLPLFLFLLQAFVFDIAFRQSNFAIYWRM